MTDDELLNERFRLYDFAEDLEPESGMHLFAVWALSEIRALEQTRVIRRQFRDLARVQMSDLDPDAFTDSLIALCRFRAQLGDPLDGAAGIEIFQAAIEVGERRAGVDHERTDA